MPKKYIYSIIVGLIGLFYQAQSTPYFLLNAGYEYQNRSYGILGASLYLVQQNDNVLNLSLNANMGSSHGDFLIFRGGSRLYFFGKK